MSVTESSIKSSKKRIENNDRIIEKNKELIFEFDRYMVLNNYSLDRRYKYMIRLPKYAEQVDVPFDEAEKKDVEDMIMWVQKKDDISERTKSDYKVLLKRFYKWIGGGEYPDEADWIKPTHNTSKKKLPDKLLNEEDVKKLIKAANNPRDRAIISLLWETGARIGELMDIKVDSFEDNSHGLKVVIEGKTGSRRLPIIESVPYIRAWLNSHPRGDRKGVPFWVNIGTRNHGKKYSYRSLNKMLNTVAERAGVNKPVNPHHFRHSRATFMANRFTESQMYEWFGWVPGSKMVGRYVHLSGRDIDYAYNKMHGIIEEDENDISDLSPKECPRCGKSVPPDAEFCFKCGMALNIEASKRIDEKEEMVTEKFSELAKEDPQRLEDMQMLLKMVKIIKNNDDLMDRFNSILEEEISMV